MKVYNNGGPQNIADTLYQFSDQTLTEIKQQAISAGAIPPIFFVLHLDGHTTSHLLIGATGGGKMPVQAFAALGKYYAEAKKEVFAILLIAQGMMSTLTINKNKTRDEIDRMVRENKIDEDPNRKEVITASGSDLSGKIQIVDVSLIIRNEDGNITNITDQDLDGNRDVVAFSDNHLNAFWTAYRDIFDHDNDNDPPNWQPTIYLN